jgi:HEAT repeat protein
MLTDLVTGADRLRVPPPRDISASPKILVGELRELVGEPAVVALCLELLHGAPPEGFRDALWYLAAQATPGVLEGGGWQKYWARVWGARGLLYVWSPDAAPPVVAGLADPAWRVAEMCLKVAALRELAEAGDAAVAYTRHELPRVRANAVRTLGLVGDTEHVDAVQAVLEDDDALPRKAATLAMRRLAARLDLPSLDR